MTNLARHRALLEAVEAMYATIGEERDIRIDWEAQGGAAWLYSRDDRLNNNAIEKAAKACGKFKRVTRPPSVGGGVWVCV